MNNFLILHQTFTDIDELAVALNRQRYYRLTQLQPAPTRFDLHLVDLDVAQFFFLKSNCSIQATGDKSQGFIEFALLLNDQKRPYLSYFHPMTSQHLFGFDSDREVNSVLAPNLQLALFRIHKTVLEDYLCIMDRSDINSAFLKQNHLFLGDSLSLTQDYLKSLFYLVKTHSPLLTQNYLQKMILEDFLPLLIAAIPPQEKNRNSTITPRLRTQLVQQAREYMLNHLDQPITLKDLCQNLHAGSRTISYGFEEVLGVSPIAYLKILRLQGVRQALKKTAPHQTTVMEVAHRFGFWSAGHFTRDYKNFFGELPSVTLEKSSLSC